MSKHQIQTQWKRLRISGVARFKELPNNPITSQFLEGKGRTTVRLIKDRHVQFRNKISI